MTDIIITTIRIHNDIAIIRLNGMLNGNTTDEFEEAITKLFDENIFRLIFDMAELTMITSSGIGALIKITSICKENRGNVVIVQPQRSVEEASLIFGLFNFISMAKDVDEAAKIVLQPAKKR